MTLTKWQKEQLITSLTTLKFKQGTKIVNEGDPGDLFYLLKEGNIICYQNGEEIRRMQRGDFFGEQALLYNCTRTATVVADGEVCCVVLNRETLANVLGEQL